MTTTESPNERVDWARDVREHFTEYYHPLLSADEIAAAEAHLAKIRRVVEVIASARCNVHNSAGRANSTQRPYRLRSGRALSRVQGWYT